MTQRVLPPCGCRRYCTTDEGSEVRVRFAPSPTGQLHLGGLRTALYNFLFARSRGGKFILRIEDTDQTRIVPGATEKLTEMLDWAGIGIDEGPFQEGSYGPYLQSNRLDLYWQHIETLLQNGTAYRCFCAPKRLDLLRKDALRRREVPKYDNRCRHLTPEDVDKKLKQNAPYVIRFKLEPYKDAWQDLVYGPIVYDVASIEGDPVLLKTDRFPTYHFANVVDDHLMRISHVLRGVEWQNSTTKHVLLYKAFNWTPPQFAHLPLLLNKDGTKLSKRQGDIHVEHFKSCGYFPESVINLLTIAGSGFDVRHTDTMTLDDLVTHFDISRVNSHSTRIDLHRLKAINHGHIQQKLGSPERAGLIVTVRHLVNDYLKERLCSDNSLQDEILSDDYIGAVLDWSQTRIHVLEDLTKPELEFIWVIPSTLDLTQLSANFGDDIRRTLERTVDEVGSMPHKTFMTLDTLSRQLKELARSCDLKYSTYMHLLRNAISGLKVGPSVAEMMTVLGQKNTARRLQYVIDHLPRDSAVASR